MTVIDAGARDEGGTVDEENAAGHIHGICLKTGPPRRVGVELEWLVRDARDPALPVPAGRIAAAVTAFDAGRGNPDQRTTIRGSRARAGAADQLTPGRAAVGGTAHHRAGRAA